MHDLHLIPRPHQKKNKLRDIQQNNGLKSLKDHESQRKTEELFPTE